MLARQEATEDTRKIAVIAGPKRVNPKLYKDIVKLGGEGILRCYDCGTCTASCPLAESAGVTPYPRRIIKYIKLGLEERLLASLEPWLCYYCGDCSDSCPKGANPASVMMAVRRYLTTRYDFTGLSRFMYLSRYGWFFAVIVVALITLAIGLALRGPAVTSRVELETFAPIEVVDAAGIIVFISLASILLLNIRRMYKFTVGSIDGIPKSTVLKEALRTLAFHFFTQKRLLECNSRESRRYWLMHIAIFFGYGISLILFVFLLRFTLTNKPFLLYHPLSYAGLVSSILLLAGASYAVYGRIRGTQRVWERSHHTDWMFIVLLLLVTVTGLLTGIFRTLGLPTATYVLFAMHIVLAAPFLILEVPFAKWSHLAYRPMALFFYRLNRLKEEVRGVA